MFADHERQLMMQILGDDMIKRLRDQFGFEPVQYGQFIDSIANETPARLNDIDDAIMNLRQDQQLTILNSDQRTKRALRAARTDYIEINRQTTMFTSQRPRPQLDR